MLALPSSVGVYLFNAPVDMRKSIDGLAALVKQHAIDDLYSGRLFVFCSRRRDRIKVLAWDRGGFVVYYKRLERDRFHVSWDDVAQRASVRLLSSELVMLLDGVDYHDVPRAKVWEPPKKERLSIDTR